MSESIMTKDSMSEAIDWSEKLQELYTWTGSAWLAKESDEDLRSDLYGFLCSLIGFFHEGEAMSRASQPVDTGVVEWLRSIVDSDWDEIIADGGVTAGMVIQQEAREQLRRLDRALLDLAKPVGGRVLEDALSGEIDRIDEKLMLLDTVCNRGEIIHLNGERIGLQFALTAMKEDDRG